MRRWVRAAITVAYALLPVATAAVAQGRLDVVVVHIVAPLVVAGITGLLVRADARWLHVSVLSALGVALLGAFSPLALAVVGAFVVLPLALLLPWPTVLLKYPELLVHGLGGPGRLTAATELAGLDPGDAGA